MQDPKKKKPETSIYQKLNAIADVFIRLVAINLLIIITSIPVVTFYPAVLAGYKMFHDYMEKDETPIVKGYFGYFKEQLLHRALLGLLLFFVIAFGYWNVTYYVDQLDAGANLFFQVGYYVTFAFLVAIYALSIYTLLVYKVFPNLKLSMVIKLSFYVSGKFVLYTVASMVLFLVPFVLLLTPTLFLLFVFLGISTPLWGFTYLMRKPQSYIKTLESLS